jgi:hypothetical protein
MLQVFRHLIAGDAAFFDQEYDSPFRQFVDLDPVSSLADEVGNIDQGQRIGAKDPQKIAGLQGGQRFASLQHWQWAIQSDQIENGRCHDRTMGEGTCIVKRNDPGS